MRILIATDAFPPKVDGVADTSALLARKLAVRGHRVTVRAPGPGPDHGPGYRVIRLASVGAPTYSEVRLSLSLPRAARLARRGGWDAAILPTPGPIGLTVAAALPRSTRIINIYTTDIPRYLEAYGLGRFSGVAERLLRGMSARSIRTLCPTTHVHDDLRNRGFKRLEVWGRGVDTDLFRPGRGSAEVRERLSGGEPEKPLALFVGRLAREKRILHLLEAARQVSGVRFAFVGDGPQRKMLEARFAGVPAVFTGYLRGEDLGAAYASADMFVFPSDTETFGQVVLQAMASGLPAIVAGCTATSELVPPGVAGLHVAPGRPAALAMAINRLANEPSLRDSMSRAAVECAGRYSWDALVQRIEVMLEGRNELETAFVPTGDETGRSLD